MIRLHILVEGQTEDVFVRLVIGPHLAEHNVWVTPIIVATRRDSIGGKHRGGGHWKQWEQDLRQLTKDKSSDIYFTCLFDLYGLPLDFPSIQQLRSIVDTDRRITLLEQAIADSINAPRFIPYIQRHEFEALVLASLDGLIELLDNESDRRGAESLKTSLGALAPEDVNEGPNTAPSKRIVQAIKGYQKHEHGPKATERVGMAALRTKCPRFNKWITKLEALGTTQP